MNVLDRFMISYSWSTRCSQVFLLFLHSSCVFPIPFSGYGESWFFPKTLTRWSCAFRYVCICTVKPCEYDDSFNDHDFSPVIQQKWTIFFCCGELLTCSIISSLCHGILLEKWVYCIFTVRSLDLERRVERGRGPTQQWLIKVMVQIITVRSVVILPLYNVKQGSLCSTIYFFPSIFLVFCANYLRHSVLVMLSISILCLYSVLCCREKMFMFEFSKSLNHSRYT